MRTGYEATVLRFVDERFPMAESVIVAGSTAREERTATSDIDLLLLGGGGFLGQEADSLAATFSCEGEPIEVFAYTAEGFERWARRGVEEARPVIVRMLIEGIVLRGGPGLAALQGRWGPILARGPEASPHTIDLHRYAATDLLDDLADARDPFERRIIADALLQRIAAIVLLSDRRWLGTGKHLARALRAWDAARAEQLAAPYLAGDLDAFAAAARIELDVAGGRLQGGFVR
ncbi:nucleotidyltransferase domain-containing protein [Brachybacterium hainanense]|uniref:Nucleotidyltransferase domain-containing protein n=1 Tax=Brachybacterium hainanense TaxID=1541174 RepID=A0ABV6RE89_9MICO